MTPWKLERLVQKCAKWMFSADKDHSLTHQPEERLWFAPAVLTPLNRDQSNPHIDIEDAREVFVALEKRHLIFSRLMPMTDPNGNRTEVVVFLVNREKEKDWQKLVSKSGFFSMGASPLVYYFFGSERPWFWLLLAFFSAAFFGELFKKFGDDFYNLIKSFLPGN